MELTKEDFTCPISLQIFNDPVLASDGHHYEKILLEEWIRGKRTSPMTGTILSKQYFPD